MKRGLTSIFVALLVIGVLVESPARAKKKKQIRTHAGQISAVVEGSTVTSVFGTIEAKDPCRADRDVTVTFASVKGGTYSTYGAEETDADGRWDLAGSVPDTSHFKIHIGKKKVGKIICLGAKADGFF